MYFHYFLVFLGGGLGSVCRFFLGRWLNQLTWLPWGTLIANGLGCFLIGLIISILPKDQPNAQAWTFFLATGFCGGFTTFSTFAFENNLFLRAGSYTNFILYSGFSLVVCLSATYIGMLMGEKTM
jgi:CrcB protein